MKRFRRPLLSITAMAVMTLAGLAASYVRSEETPQAQQVAIDDFAFSPQLLTVRAGTTVAWVNRDAEAHAIKGADLKELRSPALDEDQSFSFTFATPGIYAYFCALHPHMTGTIVVR